MLSHRSGLLMLLALVSVVAVSLSVSVARQWGGEAKRRDCQVNLEKIGQAFRLYQNDYGCLPEEVVDRWLVVSLIYGVKPKPCPFYGSPNFGYGDNQLLDSKVSLDDLPPVTALVWDGTQVTPEEMKAWSSSPTRPIPGLDRKRHTNNHGNEGANILLADGHAAFFYARTKPEKLLPFFDPDVARTQTKLNIKED